MKAKLACIAVVAVIAGLPLSAAAGSITWKIRSYSEYSVQVEFYAQSRDHAWPGNNRAYQINDYKVHTYKLSCINGEQICYGAWLEGDDTTYWGAGNNNQYQCDDCCYVCGEGDTQLINLNE